MAKKKKDSQDDDVIRLAKIKKVVDRIFNDTSETRRKMTRYLKEYRGQWWDEKELKQQDSKVFVNYVFSTAMSTAPLLTDNRPTWRVNAKMPFLQKAADLYNKCLEYLWDKLEMDRKVLRWVLNALIMKKGYLQVSFDPNDGVTGEIRVDVVDPRTFFIAPGYDDLWDAPFCGHRILRPLSWIRKHYPEKGDIVQSENDKEPEEGDMLETIGEERENWQLHSENATVYTVWMEDSSEYEFEDPKSGEKRKEAKYPHGKFMVFTRSVILEEKASIYRHSKPPFVDLEDYPDPVDFMGMGEADQIEELNRSYNRGMQLIDKFVTLYCDPNWMADTNSGIDVETIKSQLAGGGNVFAYNSMANANPVARLDMGDLPQTLFNFMSATPKVIEEVTGVTDVSKGQQNKTEKSASEAMALVESSYTRTRQKVRNFEFSLKRVGWLFVELMQQFYTEERHFSYSTESAQGASIGYQSISSSPQNMEREMRPREPNNPEDPKQQQEYAQDMQDYEQFMEFIRKFGEEDYVYADFDVTVESNSTLPMDKQSLANLFLRLLQMKAIDPRAVLEHLKVPGYKEIIARMEQQAQAAMKAKQGQAGPKPRMPGPQSQKPQGLSQMMNVNAQPEGV